MRTRAVKLKKGHKITKYHKSGSQDLYFKSSEATTVFLSHSSVNFSDLWTIFSEKLCKMHFLKLIHFHLLKYMKESKTYMFKLSWGWVNDFFGWTVSLRQQTSLTPLLRATEFISYQLIKPDQPQWDVLQKLPGSFADINWHAFCLGPCAYWKFGGKQRPRRHPLDWSNGLSSLTSVIG